MIVYILVYKAHICDFLRLKCDVETNVGQLSLPILSRTDIFATKDEGAFSNEHYDSNWTAKVIIGEQMQHPPHCMITSLLRYPPNTMFLFWMVMMAVT